MKRLALIAALILTVVLVSGPAFAATSGISANHSAAIMLVGDGLLPCHASANGGIRYNSTTARMQFCNATTWADITSGAGSAVLSNITAALVANTINNAAFAVQWQWNTLAGASGLTLSTTSPNAVSNTQTLLNLSLTGANNTQTTTGEKISNAHTGTASTNIGLYATASGGTNNYAAIFAAGRVGIGTTAPLSQLHIVGGGASDGQISLSAYGTGNSPALIGRMARGTQGSPTATQSGDRLLYLGGEGYGATAFPAAPTGGIGFNATENYTDAAQGSNITFAATPNGSVTPNTQLTLDDTGLTQRNDLDIQDVDFNINNNNATGGAFTQYAAITDAGKMVIGKMANEVGWRPGGNFLGTVNDTGGGDLLFLTHDTEWMRITQGGLLGIGVTSPAAMVDISSGTTDAVRAQTDNQNPWGLVINDTTFGSGGSAGLSFWQYNSGLAEVDVNSGGNSNLSAMQIDSSGNLYLGHAIDVYAGNNATLHAENLGIRQNFGQAYFDSWAQIYLDFDTDGTNTNFFVVRQGSAGTNRLKVDTSGNFDIATAGTYINWGATDGTTGYGFRDNGGTIQRKNSGGSWANIAVTSDRRLKRDIADLSTGDGEAAILKLRPVRFRWKDAGEDKTNGPQVGLIAQEAEAVLPESGLTYDNGDVTLTLADGTKEKLDHIRGMHYEKLVAPLIAAVQQRQAEIDRLKAEHDSLKQELRELEKQVAGGGLKQ